MIWPDVLWFSAFFKHFSASHWCCWCGDDTRLTSRLENELLKWQRWNLWHSLSGFVDLLPDEGSPAEILCNEFTGLLLVPTLPTMQLSHWVTSHYSQLPPLEPQKYFILLFSHMQLHSRPVSSLELVELPFKQNMCWINDGLINKMLFPHPVSWE